MSEKLSDEQVVVILNRMAEVLRGIGANDLDLRQMQYDDGSWSRIIEPTVGSRRGDFSEPPSSENAYTGIPISEVIRSEQGEPSDAQVEAALDAWGESYELPDNAAMRAALLAAGGVK